MSAEIMDFSHFSLEARTYSIEEYIFVVVAQGAVSPESSPEDEKEVSNRIEWASGLELFSQIKVYKDEEGSFGVVAVPFSIHPDIVM